MKWELALTIYSQSKGYTSSLFELGAKPLRKDLYHPMYACTKSLRDLVCAPWNHPKNLDLLSSFLPNAEGFSGVPGSSLASRIWSLRGPLGGRQLVAGLSHECKLYVVFLQPQLFCNSGQYRTCFCQKTSF